MKLVLIGIPGAGKSTQGNLLSRQLDIPYLSTGHIFREIAKEKTSLGRYVKETSNAGFLISDEKTIPIVNSYLSRKEYERGYILDGFPRTVPQARKFKNHVDKVVYLEIPDKESLWRLTYRSDAVRQDDTVAAIKKRIDVFHAVTQPVINFYKKQDKLVVINGLKTIQEVNKEILKSLGKQLVQNKIQSWSLNRTIILAIVGLPGSGKTEASDYLRSKKLPVVQFGKIINDYIDAHHLAHTEENHKKQRDALRNQYGKEAFAVLNEKKIVKALTHNHIVIIDGMRSWEEYLYLKKRFKKATIITVALYADKAVRHHRIAMRKNRNKFRGEARDINEILDTHMGPTIAYADYYVDNNGSLQDFKGRLEAIYRTIYFS